MTRVLADTSIVQCSYYFRHYVHSAVNMVGEGDRYLGLLGEWESMLSRGLTTFAERYEEPGNPSRSDCHAWSSSPNFEVFRTVLGIDTAAPGFQRVRIRPFLGKLERVSGSIPHPKGEISVKLERTGTSPSRRHRPAARRDRRVLLERRPAPAPIRAERVHRGGVAMTVLNCRPVKRAATALAVLLACLWPATASGQSAAGAPPARPNILWISTEDLSPDLGAYGDAYAVTPTLDRLAREGARFTNAFSAAPVCAPSRSAIITGMYPTTIGSMHMRSKAVPPAGVKAFTEYLRAAGYYCTNRSKTDYNFEAPPSNRPPDTVWDDSSEQAHWRNRPDPQQPFFAVFNILTTHESQIRLEDAQFARVTAALAPAARHDPARARIPPYYPDTPLVRKDWARYYDLISTMDGQVRTRFSSNWPTTASRIARSCSSGAITAADCRGASGSSTTPASRCRSSCAGPARSRRVPSSTTSSA